MVGKMSTLFHVVEMLRQHDVRPTNLIEFAF